jgi:hypothetical protein
MPAVESWYAPISAALAANQAIEGITCLLGRPDALLTGLTLTLHTALKPSSLGLRLLPSELTYLPLCNLERRDLWVTLINVRDSTH